MFTCLTFKKKYVILIFENQCKVQTVPKSLPQLLSTEDIGKWVSWGQKSIRFGPLGDLGVTQLGTDRAQVDSLRLGWVLRISQPLKSAYKTSTRVICQKTVNERLRWKEKRQCSKKGMEPTGQTRFEKNLHNSDYTTRKKKRKRKGYWPKPYKKWYNLMVQPVEPTINYFNKFLKVF